MKISLSLLILAIIPYSFIGQRIIPVLRNGHNLNNLYEYSSYGINDVEVFGDQLLLCGSFNQLMGQDINKLASWNGSEISSFDIGLTYSSTNRFSGMHWFQNELYIFGRFSGEDKIYKIEPGSNVPFTWDPSVNILSLNSDENSLFAATFLTGPESVLKFENGVWVSAGNSDWESKVNLQKTPAGLFCAASIAGVLNLYKYDGSSWTSVTLPPDRQLTACNAIENDLYIICQHTEQPESDQHSIYKLSSNTAWLLQETFTAKNYVPKHVVLLNDTYAVSSRPRGNGSIFSSLPDDSYWVNSPYTKNRGFGITEVISFYNEQYAIIDTDFSDEKSFSKVHQGDYLNLLENDVLQAHFDPAPAQLSEPDFIGGLYYKTGSNPDSLASVMHRYSGWYAAESGNTISAYVPRYNYNNADNSLEGSFGPVTDHFDAEFMTKYYRVWKVTRSQVEFHQDNYNNPGYVIPIDIAEWPAHGANTNGESENLAPFVDVNSDGFYNASVGDYPEIKGDQCIFWMENDKNSFSYTDSTAAFSSENIGIEIMNMAYIYETGSTALKSTIFFQSKTINKSAVDFEDFRTAIWSDFDNGFANDDYVGCDSLLEYFYCYNGDAFDEQGTGSLGFGYHPPASGFIFLDEDMFNHVYYNNSSNPINGEPATPLHHFNYMNSVWKNGQPVLCGGNGVSGTGVSQDECKYMFPAYPWEDGWNEISTGNAPSDRRCLASFEPTSLGVGSFVCRNYAVNVARDLVANFNPHWQSLELLREQVTEVKSFYESESVDINCMTTNIENPSSQLGQGEIVVFPNPGNSTLSVRSVLNYGPVNVSIASSDGRVVWSETQKPISEIISVNTENLESGIYIITLRSGDRQLTSRWIKFS
jgi:hypothetical protein